MRDRSRAVIGGSSPVVVEEGGEDEDEEDEEEGEAGEETVTSLATFTYGTLATISSIECLSVGAGGPDRGPPPEAGWALWRTP